MWYLVYVHVKKRNKKKKITCSTPEYIDDCEPAQQKTSMQAANHWSEISGDILVSLIF